MDMSLSFRMTTSGRSMLPVLLSASYAIPADIAPSPITTTTRFGSFCNRLATAMPRPAEIEVDECAAPNGSYSLSERFVKPDKPPP